jgi:hypothetical protein
VTIKEEENWEHLKGAKKTVVGASRSLGIYRERDAPTTNLQLGDAPPGKDTFTFLFPGRN